MFMDHLIHYIVWSGVYTAMFWQHRGSYTVDHNECKKSRAQTRERGKKSRAQIREIEKKSRAHMRETSWVGIFN
jgi:hypothetical protein